MSKKRNYDMSVIFGTTIDVKVKAKDLDDARDKAEFEASEIFEKLLNDGMLGTSDFSYEAYRR